MLNLKIGSAKLIDGVSYIETKQGQTGHAVYGPYETYQSGQYVADFDISGADGEALDTDEFGDSHVLVIDMAVGGFT